MQTKPKFDESFAATIQPLGNNALIVEAPEEEQGTLIIPDTARGVPQRGYVISVGPTFNSDPNGYLVKPGNYVIFSKYAGVEYKRLRDKFILIEERDILAVFKDPS